MPVCFAFKFLLYVLKNSPVVLLGHLVWSSIVSFRFHVFCSSFSYYGCFYYYTNYFGTLFNLSGKLLLLGFIFISEQELQNNFALF